MLRGILIGSLRPEDRLLLAGEVDQRAFGEYYPRVQGLERPAALVQLVVSIPVCKAIS
jgi:hypothetical protein